MSPPRDAVAGILSSAVAPAARNEEGSAHTSASIRPRSCRSISGRQRASHPSGVNSRVREHTPPGGELQDHLGRKGGEAEVGGEGDAGASVAGDRGVTGRRHQLREDVQTSGHSRTRPGAVHAAEAREGLTGLSTAGREDPSSSHGEPTGPPSAPGSRSMSSISPARDRASHHRSSELDEGHSDALGVEGKGMGPRARSLGRASPTGRQLFGAATVLGPQARRPTEAATRRGERSPLHTAASA